MTQSNDPIISHLRKDDQWHIQTNADHSEGVAELAAKFAEPFGWSRSARLVAQLHDRGKEKPDFQRYIRRASGYDPNAGRYSDKTHSLVGALLLYHKLKDTNLVLANVVAGHHRGLYDFEDLKKLMQDTSLPEDIDLSVPDFAKEPMPKGYKEVDGQHLVRMLFSCLVDADWLDTERFMQPDTAALRGHYDDMATLSEKLSRYCERFDTPEKSPLNQIRTEIQSFCREAASLEPGFFELTVPTGGGKTIASVIWAVNHALAHGKKRIIIAIPFTSIIVQTAHILRDIFGAHNVVEHHSLVDEDEVGIEDENPKGSVKNREGEHAMRLACDNWDAPIIVTTNVQLFESMFSNRPGKCRKLHSLCNSVVILDEVQALPRPLLQPIIDAMQTYARLFSTSFLFCTASQPVLTDRRKGQNQAAFLGIPSKTIRHIIPPGKKLHDALRRVSLKISEERINIEQLAEQLSGCPRVLCIVNTRKIAADIFKALPPDENNFHLSRSMCSAHLAETIAEIRSRLSEGTGPVRVIATQLIEAGVDIDFPVVYRQLAGLDSLLQAAGRCNREGKLDKDDAITHVFELKDYKPAISLDGPINATREIISVAPESDWFSPRAMEYFYRALYNRTESFDVVSMDECIPTADSIAFETIAHNFRMIDDKGKSVIVCYGEAPELIERLRKFGPSLSLTRKLALYTVSIPIHHFKDLRDVIEEPFPGFFYISNPAQYDPRLGLLPTNQYLEQSFII